jgi:DNA (cytosine-5)-methyltransferase 1
MTTVVDQFSGIGWGFACHDLGIDEHGIDIEPTVELTRKSLGWTENTCADILDLDPLDWADVDGLISSPPCQSWSRAGKGLGLDDPRGQLVWQPLVWALAIRPRFVVCEQVPEARGAFELIAHRLREVGYHATTYTISAETLGVPQTRLRVFLAAHYDRPVDRPVLTHQRYRKGRPRVEPVDMLGHLPWVSMAEALGDVMVDTRCNWMPEFDGDDRPSPTLTAVAGGKSQWTLRHIRGAGMAERHGDRPDRQLDEPSFGVTAGMWRRDYWWPAERPSTTVCADPRVGSPMHHTGSQNAGAVPVDQAGADKPVALTEAQGCALMGFPNGTAEHLQGSKADRWRIIGNAVAPPVARAVLETVAS